MIKTQERHLDEAQTNHRTGRSQPPVEHPPLLTA